MPRTPICSIKEDIQKKQDILEKRLALALTVDLISEEWERLDPEYSGPESDDVELSFPPEKPEENSRMAALLRSSNTKILAHYMATGIPHLIVRRSFLNVLEDHGWYLKPPGAIKFLQFSSN